MRPQDARFSTAFGLLVVWLLLLPAARAHAQGEAAVAILPTELSVGAGGTIEWRPAQGATVFGLGVSKVWVRDQWIEPAVEMGLGSWSNEAPCQDQNIPLADSDNCIDGYVVFGPRFRPLRASDRLWRPFAHVLFGAYWTGTGQRDTEFLASSLTLQTGGGIDLRRPRSIHGLRLSGDYRRVFAGERGRHQLQLLVSYFLGWRGAPPGGTP